MLKCLSKYAGIVAWMTGLRFAFLGVAAMAFGACSQSAPKPDDKLVAAFIEMRVAEQIYGGEAPTARLIRLDIMKKYGYTRESFIKEVNKILDDEKRWIPFELAVSERIDSLLGIPKVIKIDPKKGKK